ncbi:Golgi integral membrane protein 4 [Tupaia chinensis]|uniref:Golgi integral membrane protein 4 n=1 Tax=Tupaia chinensis TaxID=246437 RepID=L9KPT8_TUPCH|nr:Golgi integral membrane protein 4 [Tupaia chinensis]
MGNGMCSRKQKRIFQTLLLLTVVFGFLYGAMLYYELQTQLRKAEAVALKYQQHQESLSAQLQVVYEHRSRLEKSLQKERLEHKKAKEDFLVYKLEAQETLNKGRQDSSSRYSALNVQHQMLKSQHEELKKQHSDLEEEHRKQGEDFSRTFNDHKQKYLQLQQEKEQELSKLKETVYNLREENRQLRKAHQDIHTQLQDVKQQHKNLLSEHEQLVVTLEDHRSALAAAQTQVAEYKQLKDTLNRIPSFRKPDQAEPQNVTQAAHSLQGDSPARERPTRGPQEMSRSDAWQKPDAVPGRTEEMKAYPPPQKEAEFQAAAGLNQQEVEPKEPEERQMEEEHRKALEEEEMEQVGQAEHLEEEHDPSPEEQDREWKEQRQQQEAANLLEGHVHAQSRISKNLLGHLPALHPVSILRQRRLILCDRRSPCPVHLLSVSVLAFAHLPSWWLFSSPKADLATWSPLGGPVSQARHQIPIPLRGAAGTAETGRKAGPGGPAAARAPGGSAAAEAAGAPHQPQLLPREGGQQRQAGHEAGHEDGQQRQEQLRQQARYDAMDNDIVQGAEDQGIQEEEGGAYERDNQHQDEAEDPVDGREPQEHGPRAADPESEADRAVEEDINPADDPNNQGEDEFEEAEQVREENLPDENEEQKQSNQKQENAEMEEHLVMAGNPDQQEDNVDEQYQEEGEEEPFCAVALERVDSSKTWARDMDETKPCVVLCRIVNSPQIQVLVHSHVSARYLASEWLQLCGEPVQEDLTEEKKRELDHNAEETYGENDENVQEDLTEEKKRELDHNAEETYGENDENADDKNNDGEEQEVRDDNRPKGREEHYEEDEEEEEDGAAVAEKSHRRAEM